MSKSRKKKSSASQRPKGTAGRPPAPPESRGSREARRTARKPTLAERLRARPWLIAAAVGGAALIIAAVFLVIRSGRAASPTATPTAAAATVAVTPAATTVSPAVTPAAQTTPAATGSTRQYNGPPAMAIDTQKTYVATIDTAKGQMVAELYPADAPQTVNNFVFLARDGFYNGLTFHRVEPGFVIQGGDPSGNGTGGPGYTIPAEIKRKHTDGALAMARLPDNQNPNRESSGSQFYITLGAQPSLDDQYTVFGQVVQGMDVAGKIAKGDVIKSITITEK